MLFLVLFLLFTTDGLLGTWHTSCLVTPLFTAACYDDSILLISSCSIPLISSCCRVFAAVGLVSCLWLVGVFALLLVVVCWFF